MSYPSQSENELNRIFLVFFTIFKQDAVDGLFQHIFACQQSWHTFTNLPIYRNIFPSHSLKLDCHFLSHKVPKTLKSKSHLHIVVD